MTPEINWEEVHDVMAFLNEEAQYAPQKSMLGAGGIHYMGQGHEDLLFDPDAMRMEMHPLGPLTEHDSLGALMHPGSLDTPLVPPVELPPSAVPRGKRDLKLVVNNDK